MRAIIQPKSVPWQSDAWSHILAAAVREPRVLLARLGLHSEQLDLDGNLRVDHDPVFPMRVPDPFIARMRPGDPHDPLLRQVLPLARETDPSPGYPSDPLAEADATLAPGLIQKYAGRALLIASPTCAINCRYCFRREFPYAEHTQGVSFPSLRRVEADPSIHEVILSGGDPLMLKDAPLAGLVRAIEAIPHVTRLRLHTRVPVVIPQRISVALLDLLEATRLRTSMVLHVNHPNEIDDLMARALSAVHATGTTLLNQSVLLNGINDDADVLAELSERLYTHRVLPYYLHLPDKVIGTQHFDVHPDRGRDLIRALSARLPGYLVPKLAREVPGAAAKEVLSFM